MMPKKRNLLPSSTTQFPFIRKQTSVLLFLCKMQYLVSFCSSSLQAGVLLET